MAKTKLYTFYMSPYGPPTKRVVEMASLVVTCMPSLTLKHTKHHRSGQGSGLGNCSSNLLLAKGLHRVSQHLHLGRKKQQLMPVFLFFLSLFTRFSTHLFLCSPRNFTLGSAITFNILCLFMTRTY